ncbi:MAG: cysteine desulfurase [Gammaproteobacteria bacterium]|nr:cysteine desulfurase [Gammaproteobacteria bacterium]
MAVYADNNATTALDERVLATMQPFLRRHHGNPSSLHSEGRLARAAIERARAQIAQLVNCQPAQVILTSGGTEANNLAIKGVDEHTVIAVSSIEHNSILAPARYLAGRGRTVRWVQPDASGTITEACCDAALERSATPSALLSVMTANNETGAIQEVSRIAAWGRSHGMTVHTDAAQAAGKIAIDFSKWAVHMMTLSAHKLYGPKGAGALIVDKSLALEPLLHGGGHEQGLRSGTENVAAIVGFGAAAEIAGNELQQRHAHTKALRDQLEHALDAIEGITLLCRGNRQRLPNTTLLVVAGMDGETAVMHLDQHGICVSSGSACASGDPDPSHVLLAMGIDRVQARQAIRVSWGQDNTRQDVDTLIDALRQLVSLVQRQYK